MVHLFCPPGIKISPLSLEVWAGVWGLGSGVWGLGFQIGVAARRLGFQLGFGVSAGVWGFGWGFGWDLGFRLGFGVLL